MGFLTNAQVVTEALELAGNTGLTTRAQTWLALVLRELYEKFPVPVVNGAGMDNTVPNTPKTVAAGVAGITVGLDLPSHGVVRSVRRLWICTNGQTDFTELYVEHISTMDMPMRAYTGAINVPRGRPTRVIAHPTLDSVDLYFDPVPDKTYAVWVMLEGYELGIVSQIVANPNSVIPYPNDLTVVQGVFAMALKHQDDERAASEWAEFLRQASNDRGRYMNMNNANTRVRLSPRSFAPRRRGSNPWDWMGPK